jgi:hypothetical protein
MTGSAWEFERRTEMLNWIARRGSRVAGRSEAADRGASASARLLVLAGLVACQLGVASVATAQCPTCVGDANGDRTVSINELILAVNNSLFGCDRATATPTATGPTPTATPTTPVGVCDVTPGAWSAPEWATNAADALELRSQLVALTGANTMRGAEQGTVVLGGVSQLADLYHVGGPSLAEVTNPAFDPIVDEAFVEFVALIGAGTGDPIDDGGNWTPASNGGIYGESTRGINAGGLEIRQVVEKGLFAGGALYSYALGLTEGEIGAGTVDALAAAWGANEALDPNGMVVHSANYSRQMGFHAEIAAALTDAKAFAARSACGAQRDEAIRTFFRLWEQSMFARLVFYANGARSGAAASTGDNDDIDALHELGEGVGLAIGFRGLPNAQSGPLAGASRTATDAQISQILTALRLNSGDLNASTTGLFIAEPEDFAAAVTALEEVVAEIFDLDEADLETYRNPVAG